MPVGALFLARFLWEVRGCSVKFRTLTSVITSGIDLSTATSLRWCDKIAENILGRDTVKRNGVKQWQPYEQRRQVRMIFRHFLTLLTAFMLPWGCWATPVSAAPPEQPVALPAQGLRPNVLFIFLDDFGWRDSSYMGSDFYQTPNVDALAKRGLVFSNAYAGAANCAPSRACLLSGQYSPRHLIFNVGTHRRGAAHFGKLVHVPGTDRLHPDIRTWAHQIHDAGYQTGTIGKWHLSDDPRLHGFDFNFAGTKGGGPPGGYFPPHRAIDDLKDSPPDEYLTDRLTDEAISFIDRNKQRPWFLYLTHFAVHTPLQGKPELIDKYAAKPKGQLHDHSVMAAMIESVDTGIGRIIRQIEQLGLRDRTAIVFTSDNGGYGPATSMAPLKGYKGTYYEGGIRVPLLMVWPGVVAAGTTSDIPVINIDLYPTFCEMTGAELPAGQKVDGQSLIPILQGKSPLADRAIFWHFPAYLESYSRYDSQRDPLFRSRPCGVIRQGDWKLHEFFEDGALELYNLRDDIGEQNDLAMARSDKAKQLHDALIAWREQIDAPVPIQANPNHDPTKETAAIAERINR